MTKSSNPDRTRLVAQFSRPFRLNRAGRPAMGWVYFWASLPVRAVLIALMKRHYAGVENLPQSGGFIAVSNHVTEIDSVTFSHFLVANHYSPRMLMKEEMMHWPVVGFCARHSRMIPVFRETSQAADSLIAAKAALKVGECVGMFPEGTLTRDPELWPMKGHTGAARLALETQVPVVPVAQWGAHKTLAPYGKLHWPPRGRLSMVAGPPVDLSDLYGKHDDHEAVTEATRRIMADLTELLRSLRPGEEPPAKVWDMKVDGDRYGRQRKHPKGGKKPR